MSDMIAAYIECALWSSHSYTEDGELLENLDDYEASSAFTLEARADCEAFYEANSADLADIDAGQAGHDFWLTRNGHGAGFWDRGLGEVGERLTAACKPYGSVDLYVGADGEVYAA